MIRAFEDKHPVIAASAFVSEAAYVVGDVTLGERSSVWPGAVVRADFGPIRIGANTHIEDNTTLHYGPDALEIGDHVTIGHNCVVHCRRIGDSTLIGNNATLLDGAVIGSHCVVAAGAVVRPGTTIPDFSFAAGVPAQVRPLSEELRANTTRWNQGYAELAARYKAAGLGNEA
ncbi:MAG: gamma carbonic anhydrase family protein [Chloroflexi bacterium]|nr:gamma carbonic anhydrase family protein [Chloroflexota bacterium]